MTEEEIIQQIELLQDQPPKLEADKQSEIQPSPEAIEQAKRLNPIDDIFFNKMGESTEVCEEIIFPKTSERKHQFKNTEEGVMEMSDGIQALIDKKAEEAEQKTKVVDIKNVMKAFGVTVEKAMESLEIPQGERHIYAGLINKQ